MPPIPPPDRRSRSRVLHVRLDDDLEVALEELREAVQPALTRTAVASLCLLVGLRAMKAGRSPVRAISRALKAKAQREIRAALRAGETA